jgi:hypothetical protein
VLLWVPESVVAIVSEAVKSSSDVGGGEDNPDMVARARVRGETPKGSPAGSGEERDFRFVIVTRVGLSNNVVG